MFVKLSTNTTRFERNVFVNNVLNFLKDDTVIVFDTVSFVEDIESKMMILDILNAVIAIISFALGCFQLIVTISANIRDSMWELGVLRAMGMTKHEILRVMIYETMANNLSSITLGFLTGFIVSASLMAQFLLFLEIKFQLVVSFNASNLTSI